MLSNLYQVQKCDEVGDISKVIPKSRKVNTKVNTNVMRKRTKLDMKMNEESKLPINEHIKIMNEINK